jgi:Ferrochelatase
VVETLHGYDYCGIGQEGRQVPAGSANQVCLRRPITIGVAVLWLIACQKVFFTAFCVGYIASGFLSSLTSASNVVFNISFSMMFWLSYCSFVSEHIETLEEIDMEYRELALESGIVNWGRVPALGCDPTFIADLADAVIEALPYVGAMAVSNLEARQVFMIWWFMLICRNCLTLANLISRIQW